MKIHGIKSEQFIQKALKQNNSFNMKRIIKNKRDKQIFSLYLSMASGLVIGIGVSVVNTRLLGPQQFGDLKFLHGLFTFITTFLTLGIFVTSGRLLALKVNEKITQEIIGNSLIFASIISISLITLIFIFSFFEENIFHNNLGSVIRIFSPFLFIFPFRFCLENIMQGDNRIYELSLFRVGPQILYLIVALLFNYFFPLSLLSALAIQLFVITLVILIMIVLFKPKFINIKKNMSFILQENKEYGFHVYVGILAGVASNHLGVLSIGYFIDNISVGFFSLALTISMPLTMIPNAMGTTLYKDFANRNSIPRKTTIYTIIFSIFAWLCFVLAIKNVILTLYSKDYEFSISLAYLISIGCIFRGFGDFINRFLGAHGKGKDLRNSAFAVGLSNIFGYSVIVYFFGVFGAAITRVLSDLVYFSMMFLFYKKYINKITSG